MRFVRSMRELGAVEVAIGDAKVTFADRIVHADAPKAHTDASDASLIEETQPTYEELGALEDVQEDPTSNWFTQRVPSRYGNES